jgi:hypothetical protein
MKNFHNDGKLADEPRLATEQILPGFIPLNKTSGMNNASF